jgi:hypothetical protein
MKKYFLQITILLLCCFTTVAQSPKPKPNFTLKELIALTSNDDEYFDTYVTNKGFEFYKAETEGDGCERSKYAFDFSKNRVYADQFIGKDNCKNSARIRWIPENIKAYNTIKKELKINGFKFNVKIMDEDGGMNFIFKKGIMEVTLSSFEGESSNGNKKTSYGIYVCKYY